MREEFTYLVYFIILFGILVLISEQFRFYTTIAFVVGAFCSLLSGYIGMNIATHTNTRTCLAAATGKIQGDCLSNAFTVAFRGGCVMGFCLVGNALLLLCILLMVYVCLMKPGVENTDDWLLLFEFISGYGLGGSSVALFCRVGGGIYTKAADVGADLVGKVIMGMEEDSPDNPATIADNVGDNVGDIAGMGADLFGSFSESTCAALIVSGTSVELISSSAYLFPLLLSAAGILCSIITSVFALGFMKVDELNKVENTLKWQLLISTLILTPVIIFLCLCFLPETFTFQIGVNTISLITTHNWGIIICILAGLYSGLIIGWFADYYTSNANPPVQNLASMCEYGPALNIIHGLALGYRSCIAPIICLGITIFTSFYLAGMYGIAMSALGMLSNLSICLAIDGYGPISDNAGGIAEMSNYPKTVRDITDGLDAAGNTTAAIGKGFAIGSACLVALALFGAFITRTGMNSVNILEPLLISSLIIGAMMPYAFSALTMTSVGHAAHDMCKEVQRQVEDKKNKNIPLDPERCIQISTNASLKEMIIPGVLVIGTPIFLGVVFGPRSVAGYLAGVIVSGVQMAISSANSGGAWDNAKKYIEQKKLQIPPSEDQKLRIDKGLEKPQYYEKHSKPHEAAVCGDTVGDPLKDTSGPSLNILVKLSAIVSLIFGTFFLENHLIRI